VKIVLRKNDERLTYLLSAANIGTLSVMVEL